MDTRVLTMPQRASKQKRNDVPAKIDAEVMRLARIVAAYEDVDIAELVSETLRPILKERLAHHQASGCAPKQRRGRRPDEPPD